MDGKSDAHSPLLRRRPSRSISGPRGWCDRRGRCGADRHPRGRRGAHAGAGRHRGAAMPVRIGDRTGIRKRPVRGV